MFQYWSLEPEDLQQDIARPIINSIAGLTLGSTNMLSAVLKIEKAESVRLGKNNPTSFGESYWSYIKTVCAIWLGETS